jgi:hypothetical protein
MSSKGPTADIARKSFDHFVCAHDQGRRQGQPERLRGFEVDRELELRGKAERASRRVLRPEYLVGATRDVAIHLGHASK